MKQLKRKLLIALAIFIGVLLVLYATIYFICKHYLNDAEIRKLVNNRANAVIHRDIIIGDKIEFDVSWDFIPHVEISDVKVANIAVGFVGQKELISVHSMMNKLTGGMLFVLPLTLAFIDLRYSAAVVCVVATIAAIQEGYLVNRNVME